MKGGGRGRSVIWMTEMSTGSLRRVTVSIFTLTHIHPDTTHTHKVTRLKAPRDLFIVQQGSAADNAGQVSCRVVCFCTADMD